ncbi:cysteine proteinase inhibitor A-like [Magnolia sinica]|uniref:cysteine proteinase inhibitor A-like n=1 Tax=Magnolia sinica TaxID=86752 RepID=UPI002658A3B0|nr:cysteine proteinase inhibitor A-like [Magnolia sinica]
MATLGGIKESSNQNSTEISELAQFAVQEHNKKNNAVLEFVRVVNAKEQVVAGTMYYLTVEATDGGKKKLYEAKVWVKPWENFKELQQFKYKSDC